MESDIKLKDGGTVEITGDKVRADVGFGGGAIELNGSNFKTSVTDVEMFYYGGHLTAKGGNVELGSSDSGTFKGFSQRKDGTVQITGDKLKTDAKTVEVGSRSNDKFRGIYLSLEGSTQRVACHIDRFVVLNPNVTPDQQQRNALAQSVNDELLINANGDYKGGIKIDGAVNMTGDLSVQTSLIMKVGSKLLFLTPDHVKIVNGKKVRIPGQAIDVLSTIQDLQATINKLQDRITALEGNR